MPDHAIGSDPDCIFCAIVAGRASASIVAETEYALAFMDLRQAHPGHVLVIPRVHVETILDIEPTLAGEVMALAVRVAAGVAAAFGPAGMNLWQSNGEAGGQEVPHFHLHVHPREADDGLMAIYPAPPPLPRRGELDVWAARIRQSLAVDASRA